MKGKGMSHGAATIVNAIAGGKGAAFGLDLRTEATVELTSGKGTVVTMDGLPGEATSLAERCVQGVLEAKGGNRSYHAEVWTSSQIPVSRGLKSSSSAANAIVLATLDALGETMDKLDAVRIGTKAAIDAGVSITGAFDDACACALGGVVLTDNRSERVLCRSRMPDYVKAVIHVPEEQIRKRDLPRKRISAMSGLVDLAFRQAQEGDYYRALTLNGMCYSTALGLDQEIALRALQNGALAAGLTGTGPATVMLVVEDKVKEFIGSMKDYRLTAVDVFNGEGTE
ncbi:MAG: Shikimate kinase [Methanomassiliicoccales archaeon PtaB.Bin134]|nr:MAG: Shikimate kinase [Methanomassiliicoccales archaeon PtaB.Bin134]